MRSVICNCFRCGEAGMRIVLTSFAAENDTPQASNCQFPSTLKTTDCLGRKKTALRSADDESNSRVQLSSESFPAQHPFCPQCFRHAKIDSASAREPIMNNTNRRTFMKLAALATSTTAFRPITAWAMPDAPSANSVKGLGAHQENSGARRSQRQRGRLGCLSHR